jgi:hypothetical protein
VFFSWQAVLLHRCLTRSLQHNAPLHNQLNLRENDIDHRRFIVFQSCPWPGRDHASYHHHGSFPPMNNNHLLQVWCNGYVWQAGIIFRTLPSVRVIRGVITLSLKSNSGIRARPSTVLRILPASTDMTPMLWLDALLAAFALFLVRQVLKPKQSLPFPPGPKALPIIGNFFDVPNEKSWETFSKWRKQYGALLNINDLSTVH